MIKRHVYLIVGFLLINSALKAQNFEWARSFGSLFLDQGNSITVDSVGNVYVTGNFSGTVDFDPGTGTYNLTSAGISDVFVQKLDANGDLIWARAFGSPADDYAYSIAIDATGNAFVTGYFNATADFDPGPGIYNLTSTGGQDIFIQKLDVNGNFIWARSFGSIADDFGFSVAVDALGNVYTTGTFRDSADFDPGGGASIFTSAGNYDFFIQKLDINGNFIWATTIGGTNNDFGLSIEVDASGNVYTTGYFTGTADFDPGLGTYYLTASGPIEAFILKMDMNANLVWARSFGGLNATSRAITVAASGNVYTAGNFQGTVDFDPGPGTYNLTEVGSQDAFVQKLDANGNFVWAKAFGGTSPDVCFSVITDNAENVYTTGYYQETVDFDPGTGTYNLTSTGGADIFILKLDANGDYNWVEVIGGVSNDISNSIAIDTAGSLYTTGYYNGTTDFDPGVSTYNLTPIGSYDIFILKLGQQCNNTSYNDVQIACDSLTWIDGNTYTSSTNTPTWILTNSSGCDSIVTLNLTIANSISTDIISACDTYTWIDGNIYTSSTNTPIWTLTNTAGCDSIVTLDLTITNSDTGTDVVTACDSYSWIDGNTYSSSTNTPTWTLTNSSGCDSVVSLNLTITNSNSSTDVISACNSYTWIDGNTYISSTNVPTWTLTNGEGCDSIVTLNLTIDSVDVSVTDNSPILTANDSTATSYEWIYCNTGLSVPGGTSAAFEAVFNGSYAVIITDGICVDTSECYLVLNIGLQDISASGEAISVYPNPNNGSFIISFEQEPEGVLELYDVAGRVIYSVELNNDLVYEIRELSTGMYLLNMTLSNGDNKSFRIVVE